MTSAQRSYRARVFADINRKASLRGPVLPGLGSITWGTRSRSLGRMGVSLPLDDITGGINDPGIVNSGGGGSPVPFLQNPDIGVWPGLGPGPVIVSPVPVNVDGGGVVNANGLPARVPVPVVVTPTSGPIPPPGTPTAAAPSWLDQSMIVGIANKWLLLGGVGAFLMLGGKKK